MDIALKRIYEAPAASDGQRILVDRLWPRGVRKEDAHIDMWLKAVTPSAALRKWYGHDPAKWAAFEQKYRAELQGNPALAELKALAQRGKITLLYAAKDEQHAHPLVLKDLLLHQEQGAGA